MTKNKLKEINDKLTQLQKDNRLTKDEVDELKGLIRRFGNDEWMKGAKNGFVR